MTDDETTRRQVQPGDDKTVRYPDTLRPPGAHQQQLAPPGLRSAPPPVPKPREDDTLRGIPQDRTTPGVAPAPKVPKAAFGPADPAPATGAPGERRFKQTIVTGAGLAGAAPPQGPPSEPLREPPPESEPLREAKGPYARTLQMGQLTPPRAPGPVKTSTPPPPPPSASPFRKSPSTRPPSPSARPSDPGDLASLEASMPEAATLGDTPGAPRRDPPPPSTVPVGRRSGTRPKTSAPPPPPPQTSLPPEHRADAPSLAGALRLDDTDKVETAKIGTSSGIDRGRAIAIAAGIAVGVITLAVWLSRGSHAPDARAAEPPAPRVAAQPAPAQPPPTPPTELAAPGETREPPAAAAPAATPQAKPAPSTSAPKARAAKRKRRREPVEAPPPAAVIPRSAEEEEDIRSARSVLEQLEQQPVIQIKPADRETADRALQEAMGRPAPEKPPEPSVPPAAAPEPAAPAPAPSEPAPVLQLTPSE